MHITDVVIKKNIQNYEPQKIVPNFDACIISSITFFKCYLFQHL